MFTTPIHKDKDVDGIYPLTAGSLTPLLFEIKLSLG